MKKLMMLVAMLAMAVVAAVPAAAQEDSAGGATGTDQYGGSVVVTQTQAASLTQDCRTIVTVAQTGTATGGNQYSDSGDTNQTVQANLGGVTVNVTGAACQQIVNQVQAGKNAVGAVTAVVGGTPTDSAPDATPEKTAPEKTVPEKMEEPGTGASPRSEVSGEGGLSVLPDTGGVSLLVIGTGALLVSGGLLVRRFLG